MRLLHIVYSTVSSLYKKSRCIVIFTWPAQQIVSPGSGGPAWADPDAVCQTER